MTTSTSSTTESLLKLTTAADFTYSLENTLEETSSESFYSFPDNEFELLQSSSLTEESPSDLAGNIAETEIEEPDTGKIISETLSIDFDSPVLSSLETNPTDNLSGLSEELLANSTLADSSDSSLGTLYYDAIEYGDPATDSYYWRQQDGAMSCAVVAQISIYESLTGEYISEYDASNYAYQQGWFDPDTGTPVEYTGNILEVLNIDTYRTYDATLDTLEYALSVGNKPIVGLDGNEIWNPQYDWYGNSLEQSNAGHAVWVTGIDYRTDGSVGIILNDSGIADGSASVVDYYDFMNAWEDYNYFVSIADNPLT